MDCLLDVDAVFKMRFNMRLRNEPTAMGELRKAIVNEERFKRYLRVDSDALSMHLAKITSTMTYGIPVKGEPGYISDDNDEEIEGAGAGNDEDQLWKNLDPLGHALSRHFTAEGFAHHDETMIETEGPAADELKLRIPHSEAMIQEVFNVDIQVTAKFVEEVDKIASR